MIERVETAYYAIPLGHQGDAGHGLIDREEIITVKVYASGLVGEGYAYTIGRGGRAIQALIDHDLAPLLVGQDEAAVEELWRHLGQRLLYVGRGGLLSFAQAALDIALWDLRGSAAGQPLYALIGGQARAIPAYGSGVDLPLSLAELLRQVDGFIARGYPGVKVKIGRPDPEDDTTRVAAVRRAVGDGVDLIVDANMAFSVEEALARAAWLSDSHPFWYEEPTIPEDVVGHARLVEELAVPISVGESLHSLHEFRRYVAERATDIVQIDPITCGGITPAVQILALADAAGLSTSSHYADEINAHLLCASKRPIYLEKHAFALDPYLHEPQRVVNGQVRPSEAPGTGVHFDDRALRAASR